MHVREKPWLMEQNHVADLPDINYRPILRRDQGNMRWLFKDGHLHFTELCLQYAKVDVSVQVFIFSEYHDWVERKNERSFSLRSLTAGRGLTTAGYHYIGCVPASHVWKRVTTNSGSRST